MKAKNPKSERRHSERIVTHKHAEVRKLVGSQKKLPVQVMNISDGGVRFICAIPFELGEELAYIDENHTTKAVARACKPLFKGFAIRAEFTNS
jgi:hypothetical protein